MTSLIPAFIKSIRGSRQVEDETIWHKCRVPVLPRRTIDGRWTEALGQIWRRKRPDGKWEYRQDKIDDYDDLSWQW